MIDRSKSIYCWVGNLLWSSSSSLSNTFSVSTALRHCPHPRHFGLQTVFLTKNGGSNWHLRQRVITWSRADKSQRIHGDFIAGEPRVDGLLHLDCDKLIVCTKDRNTFGLTQSNVVGAVLVVVSPDSGIANSTKRKGTFSGADAVQLVTWHLVP